MLRTIKLVFTLSLFVGCEPLPPGSVNAAAERAHETEDLQREAAQSRAVFVPVIHDAGICEFLVDGAPMSTQVLSAAHACGLRSGDLSRSNCGEGEDGLLTTHWSAQAARVNEGKSALLFLRPVTGLPAGPSCLGSDDAVANVRIEGSTGYLSFDEVLDIVTKVELVDLQTMPAEEVFASSAPATDG